MHFSLIDRVVERSPERIVAVKNVSAAEEYLQDHFPTFPVLPGVFMLEALVQTARALLDGLPEDRAGVLSAPASRYTLGAVRGLKYGTFVAPGDTMRLEVEWMGVEGGLVSFRGQGVVIRADAQPGSEPPVCVSGRFTLRPSTLLVPG